MSAEIIDQANELAERRLEMTIQNMRSTITRYRRRIAAIAGTLYRHGAGNWWRAVSAALIVRKSLKNVVST